MAGARLPRRKIADYVAKELTLGNAEQAVKELAAFLVDSGRVRELDLIIRDIEYALHDYGQTIVDVTSATPLNAAVKEEVMNMTRRQSGTKNVYLREHIDPSVIGGVRLEYGEQQLDTTLRHKLNALKAKQL